jgi:hypothetical protein
MKQPDLGLKIAELRDQKSLTQEKLTEYCEVSTLPLIAIDILATYQGVVNTVRVLSDKPYKYRLSIPFVK